MPTIDVDLALHCLEDLGGRTCPIVKQRSEAMRPIDSEACGGLSIRDTLLAFLSQAIGEAPREPSKKRRHQLYGQIDALKYAIALMDNPYRPDVEAVQREAEMEVESGLEG
jgi:hypothetical protein